MYVSYFYFFLFDILLYINISRCIHIHGYIHNNWYFLLIPVGLFSLYHHHFRMSLVVQGGWLLWRSRNWGSRALLKCPEMCWNQAWTTDLVITGREARPTEPHAGPQYIFIHKKHTRHKRHAREKPKGKILNFYLKFTFYHMW